MRWILVVVALWLPASLVGQAPPPLHVEGVGEPVTVGVAMHRGYPAYPAWTLRGLGARVESTAGGAAVVFGSDTLRFEIGSPFFRAGGAPRQLVEPPYREGGILYLPHQLFAEWLPRSYPDQLEYVGGHLRLKGAETAAAAPTADPAPVAPAPTGAAGTAGPAGVAGDGSSARTGSSGGALGDPSAVPIVVVDAGHGGPDPGRIGPSGLKEKDVVLQVSKRLAQVLAERGYEVRMTRTTDTLIPLADRPHLANEWRGTRPGLFLSIHANGVSDRRIDGFETFFLSDARTEDERRVAEMENAAVAYESPNRLAASDDLGLIYNNLRNEFYIRASNSLAGLIQGRLDDFHRGNDRGVKQAGFRVLVGAFMPAVLVELAFISNPAEERLLGSGRFQVQVAEGIADAVDRFFQQQGDRWGGAAR